MKNRHPLANEVLNHLELYRDLGVRWVRRFEVQRRSFQQKKEMKTQAIPAAGMSPPNMAFSSMEYTSMFDLVPSAGESLEEIREDLGDCRRCKLSSSRKNMVFGSGNPHAELMFVGEAPGADEDKQGMPFVGRAGQLLTKIIEAMGMKREGVYICNILKCRPPNNRNPETDEIGACEPFLFRQVDSVKPKVICALGAFGAQTLLHTSESIGRLRGKLIDYRGAKLMATYHPAYLLRNPIEKRKVWEDMKIVRDYLQSLKNADES